MAAPDAAREEHPVARVDAFTTDTMTPPRLDDAALDRSPRAGAVRRASRTRLPDDASVVLTRRTHVAHVHLWSVAKVAFVFWSLVALLVAGATFMTWTYLTASGAVGNAEEFVADLTGLEEFRIMSATLGIAMLALAGLFVVVAVTLTVAAAAFYNVLTRAVGGVEVTTVEALPVPARPPQPQQSVAPAVGAGQSSDGHAA